MARNKQTDNHVTQWVSIDPAWTGRSGFCRWGGEDPTRHGVIRPIGKNGKWGVETDGEKLVFDAERDAWKYITDGSALMVVEVGHGSFRSADLALGKRLGYLYALCQFGMIEYRELQLSEWRRILKEQSGFSWPSGSDAKKALTMRFVQETYGIDAGADEADAIAIGYSWIRSGRTP